MTKAFQTGRASQIVSWTFVVGRTLLVIRFFIPFTWPSAIFGVSECWALGMSARNYLTVPMDKSGVGLLLPVCYCAPLLLRQTAVVGCSGVYLMTACFVWIALRFRVGEQITLGVASYRRVMKSGPYAVIRHPLACLESCTVLLFAGSYPSTYNLLIALPLTLCGVVAVLIEESYLRSFPEYRAYARVVPYRLLPGVW
jgi:protein-S-isoprenylcysteine O-methyltransferase Ste14